MISFNKTQSGDVIDNCTLQMSPAANFTNINTAPNNLTVIVKDNNRKEFKSSLDFIDFSQKETLLKT